MAISPKLLNPGEKLIISTRTHPKALFLPILVLVLFLVIGVLGQVYIDVGWLTLTVWVLCLLGILRWTLAPFLDWLTTVHGVTDRRLITRHGLITRRGHDITLARISDIQVEIHLLDRPFGCGSLLVTDAATFGVIRLDDIPHVEATQRTINELLNDVHRRSGADEGA